MSAVDGIDEFAAKLAGILKEKNAAYGDSFARVPTMLETLFPDVPPETLGNILFFARIFDKAGRITQDPLGAGEDAYLDLAGYALLQANVQRLKRAAKAATEPKAPRTGVMFVGDEAVEYAMPAEASPPSEPNGRIKADRLPDVRIVMGATVDWADAGQLSSGHSHGWYLHYPPENTYFNAYGGGFWMPDTRDATAFPSRRDAAEYCRVQGELNAMAAKSLLYSGDWSAAVATGVNDAWVIWWPAMGQYFQAPHMDRAAKWIANPNEATKFDSKDAANGLIEYQKAGWASCE